MHQTLASSPCSTVGYKVRSINEIQRVYAPHTQTRIIRGSFYMQIIFTSKFCLICCSVMHKFESESCVLRLNFLSRIVFLTVTFKRSASWQLFSVEMFALYLQDIIDGAEYWTLACLILVKTQLQRYQSTANVCFHKAAAEFLFWL